MQKPYEVVEAEMIYGLAQAYHALPERGSVMDQPVWVLRMHAILDASGYFGERATAPAHPADPLAAIPMAVL